MKLVIEHHDSDGCTWSATNTYTVKRISKASLQKELDLWASKYIDKSWLYHAVWKATGITPECVLGTSEYASIDIYELDDWFEQSLAESS